MDIINENELRAWCDKNNLFYKATADEVAQKLFDNGADYFEDGDTLSASIDWLAKQADGTFKQRRESLTFKIHKPTIFRFYYNGSIFYMDWNSMAFFTDAKLLDYDVYESATFEFLNK